MAEQCPERPNEAVTGPGASVCIHTSKIMDSCVDKDCVESLRVYLTRDSQNALDHSTSAKVRCVELLHVYIDVEPISFHRGHYAVDLTFYYRVQGDVVACANRPTSLTGLAVFTKRVVLYGGESGAKSFSSRSTAQPDCSAARCPAAPEAIVESLDPIILAAKVKEVCDCRCCEAELTEVPEGIRQCFDGELVLSGDGRRLYVTIGQFSTIRLERGAQMSIQSPSSCIPTKECCSDAGCEEDPCEMFSRIDFPYDAFYPRARPADCCTE